MAKQEFEGSRQTPKAKTVFGLDKHCRRGKHGGVHREHDVKLKFFYAVFFSVMPLFLSWDRVHIIHNINTVCL